MTLQILHVVPTYLPATRYGGPIYSVHGLCKALVGRGHGVQVFTTNVDGPGVSAVPLGRPVDRDGVEVTYFPAALGRRLYRSPAMASALAASLADFDIVHLHSVFLWPTNAAAQIARERGVPYILSPRGMLVDELIRRKTRILKTAWIALFERANLAGAAAVHATAQIEADEIRKLGLFTRRIAVIPNGIDMPAEDAAEKEGIARRPAGIKRRLLSLGRLNWKKGLERLIDALPLVADAELVLAGPDEDGYRERLERLAAERGVAGRVSFTGAVEADRKWDLIRSADLFVMPSYSENFGLAALEAMACGVPVVVTPEVGLAAAIAQAGAGLVTPAAPETLGPALAGLLSDSERRARLGAAARAAATQYSWPAIAARMAALYAECVRPAPAAATIAGR